MDRISQMNNGMFVGMSIAEITTIPYFELIDKNIDRANQVNQVFFAQLLNNFYRKSDDGMSSLEIMFLSTGVDNQTYRAQVKMFFTIRQIGNTINEVEERLNSFESSLKNEFTDNFYDIQCNPGLPGHTKSQPKRGFGVSE